jgi:uncharacterized membrane protein
MSNYELRKKAMDLLREKYTLPIAYVFITFIISSIIGSLSAQGTISEDYMSIIYTPAEQLQNFAVSILSFLIGAGIAYGAVHVWRSVVVQAKPNLETALVSGFKTKYIRNVLLNLLMNVYIILWMLLLVIPGIVKYYAYAMSFYVVNREPETTPSEALRRSSELMKGEKMQLFTLDLSYIGWYFLGLLTCGILWLWIIPRHNVARMILFEELYEADLRARTPVQPAAEPATVLPEPTVID